MSYCTNCGAEIMRQTAKYCHECGASLEIGEESSFHPPKIDKKSDSPIAEIIEGSSSNSSTVDKETDLSKKREILFESKEKSGYKNSSIYELGMYLEDWVENILKAQGYSTQRRVRLNGKNGKSEIDIIAKRWIRGSEERIAVECKNYKSKVPVDEIRIFKSKIDDLEFKNGLFAVYTDFTSDASEWGNHCGLELWDGETVKEKYFETKVGRLKEGEVARFEYCYQLPLTLIERQN